MAATATEPGDRIVVGYDGSTSAKKALEWAANQADVTGALLEVITTWTWPTSYGAPLSLPEDFDPAASAQAILDEAAQYLKERFAGVRVRFDNLEGPAAPALVKASEGASLLVVGSRGHGEFVGMLLGSVSEHGVAHAQCPVLVLRTG